MPELGLTLRQPKIKEIAMLGEADYFLALSVFNMTKESLKIVDPNVTNWMVFLEALNQQIEGVNVRLLLSNFLQLFLVEKLNIGPRSLIIQNESGIVNIENEQFDIFQKLVLQVGGVSLLNTSEEEFKPGNKRAAEIAEKMRKARARKAAMQPRPKSKGFLSRYVRAVAVATSNSIKDACDMTLLQLNEIVQSYLAWEAYDLEIRSRLAGAPDGGKIEHWMMRSLERENDSIGTI
ncbi:MAG: hypothetical protein GX025_10955 [Clostridiales bacterium]|nr:hypothetical protein [Clostridiales bacterium]